MSNQDVVFMDGEYVDMDKAVIPIRNHAFLYGTSIFEGIRAYYNEEESQMYAFRVKEHMERILKSAKIMHMSCKYDAEGLCDIAKEILKKNNYNSDAYLRPQIYKSALKIGPGLLDNPDSLLMFTIPLGNYFSTEKGLKVCVSNWRRTDDNSIPPRAKVTGNYANTALAITDAKLAGFDDAIVLSHDGHVTEGSAMNLFLVQDGKLVTSNITDNILVGITRNTIIEIAKEEFGIETIEREIDRTELYISDEAFFCGTGAQIAPIESIDNRKIGNDETGPITKKLQSLYFDVVRGKVNKYRKWCMPIYD